MKKTTFIVIILTVLLLFLSLYAASKTEVKREVTDKKDAVFVSKDERVLESMRGLWVSYITLDMRDTDLSFESFKKKFDTIVKDAKNLGCNTLIVQVRPFSDALYNSSVYPSSHILSAEQGKDCGYDALEYMCEKSHEEGLFLHAWINPYRVSTASSPEKLSDTNPYIADDEIGFETNSGKYLNPASRKAREIIIEGVKEIVQNYPVDGIQFDDYFYPSDCGDFDKEYYNTYLKAFPDSSLALPLKAWRQNNINLLLSETYIEIKRINPSVMFGVSPQGNIQNDLDMGADVISWCKTRGYLDYICPQMYYSIDNPLKSFKESIIEWSELECHNELEVYIGLGAYKLETDADSGTWLKNHNELKAQLELLREYGFDGYMIYDYSAIISAEKSQGIEVFREAVYEEMTSAVQ